VRVYAISPAAANPFHRPAGYPKPRNPARPVGHIGTTALLASVWAAAQACFLRAGIANEVKKTAS
jgi:hypothetical protein